MPWSETCPMNERRKFIEEWLQDDCSLTDLSRGFGISRKTAYKWIERFKQSGFADLGDQSRAHRGHPFKTTPSVEASIITLRQKHPFFGPRKLKKRLSTLYPGQPWPATSTIGGILKHHGLAIPRRKRWRTPAYPGPLSQGLAPNDVWAADFKGWFKTADGMRIDPLTVTDCASRYLIKCRAVAQTNGDHVRAQFTATFQEFGMPGALRTDNGVPFATVGLGGLSELSVWLIRLGIRPERIRPAHPQDNGAHERMHRTLKQETARPPRANMNAQQRRFDAFRNDYNEVRPHESLNMQTPTDVYRPSERPFPRRLPDIEYPAGSTLRFVTDNGTIKFKDTRIYLSNALIDQFVRIEDHDDGYQVWFGPKHLGQLDLKTERIEPAGTKCYP